MVDYSQTAIKQIRQYIIHELHESGVLDDFVYPSLFNNKIPVVPFGQMSETVDTIGDKPFIVYNVGFTPRQGTMYWIMSERANLTVVTNNVSKLMEIFNMLTECLQRFDMTALDINDLVPGSNVLLNVSVESTSIADPADSEDGRVAGMLTIVYDYTRQIDPSGRFAS